MLWPVVKKLIPQRISNVVHPVATVDVRPLKQQEVTLNDDPVQRLINKKEAQIEQVRKEILALVTVIPILVDEPSDIVPTDVRV